MDVARRARLYLVVLAAIVLPVCGVALSVAGGPPPSLLVAASRVTGLALELLAVASLVLAAISIPILRAGEPD